MPSLATTGSKCETTIPNGMYRKTGESNHKSLYRTKMEKYKDSYSRNLRLSFRTETNTKKIL